MRQCFIKVYSTCLSEVASLGRQWQMWWIPITIVIYFGRLRDGLLDWGRLIRGTVLILMIATQLNRDGSGLGGGECNVLPECHEEGVKTYPHG